jgi:hypothetical protein
VPFPKSFPPREVPLVRGVDKQEVAGTLLRAERGDVEDALRRWRPTLEGWQAPDASFDWEHELSLDAAEPNRLLVAVRCDGEVQGLMSLSHGEETSRLTGQDLVYVEYLSVAPWNQPAPGVARLLAELRYKRVGIALLVAAAALSRDDLGLGGRVGLHSKDAAVSWYKDRKMTPFPIESTLDGSFVYFEGDEEWAIRLLGE